MRKGTSLLLAAVLLLSLGMLPFLCSHCSILPEKVTEYYERKAAQDAQSGQGAEAELMRLLLGGMPQPEAPEPAGLTFFWYGLALALSAGLGILALFLFAPRDQQTQPVLLWASALAVPLGLIGARLVYCIACLGFYLLDIQNPAAMLRLWEGGLSLTGALVFAVVAGMIAARIQRRSIGGVLDAMVPGLLVFSVGARLCEMVIGAGFGPEVPFSLPVLTRTIQDASRLNTALLMALAALAALPLCHVKGKPGRRFLLAAFQYGGALLLLESLRRDGHLLWGFVHAEQLFALLMALPALLALTKPLRRLPLALGGTALLAAAIIALEFALDRSAIGDLWLYLLYFALVGAYLAWGHACAKRVIAL